MNVIIKNARKFYLSSFVDRYANGNSAPFTLEVSTSIHSGIFRLVLKYDQFPQSTRAELE